MCLPHSAKQRRILGLSLSRLTSLERSEHWILLVYLLYLQIREHQWMQTDTPTGTRYPESKLCSRQGLQSQFSWSLPRFNLHLIFQASTCSPFHSSVCAHVCYFPPTPTLKGESFYRYPRDIKKTIEGPQGIILTVLSSCFNKSA